MDKAAGADPAHGAGYREPIRDPAQLREIEGMAYENVVPVQSVPGLIDRAARLFPDRPALTYLEEGTADEVASVLSFAELQQQVHLVATGFRALASVDTPTVALLMPAMPETFVSLFAAELAGRVCPINYMLSPDSIAEILRQTGARILVTLAPCEALNVWDKVERLRDMVPTLETVISVGAEVAPGAVPFTELHLSSGGALLPEPARDDLAAWFHTGGTTGAPKLVRHTHGNQVHVSWFGGLYFGIGPDDVVLNGFPLFHVAGSFVLGGSAIAAGANTVVPSRFGMRNKAFVRDFWKIVERYRVTLLSGGPTFLTSLVATNPDRNEIRGVKAHVGGGSFMPEALIDRFEAATGVPVRPIYGMTEAAGMISAAPRHCNSVAGSVGWALPFCEIAAFGAAGRRLQPEETGTLCIRGPNVSPGYADPKAGSRDPSDWFETGDLGYVSADGAVFVTGRAKDVIIRGGHNIDPAGIEEALSRHPDVAQCAAVGMPDAYAGELPMAFVQLKADAKFDESQLRDFAAGQVPERAATPVLIVEMDDLPLTTTGKIFRPTLRERAAELAFRRLIEENIVGAEGFALTCNDKADGRELTITLAAHADTEALREAIVAELSGFPVQIEMRRNTTFPH
ncbi:AMP-binding protein [Maritimibacter sp. UBA3975]|uniref:AMP-binding protein n=1 Tax=Maritimibacter sp. UBA3975 TaxID=1946833 RepID=UPI0025BA66BD|nr:AMP-binding protein [Maritimibacter sp. UBA3975]|tara:strand:- start:17575 stop:19455 length:1881 start_codon:yes stop_codon:yes gene_type:complete